MATYDGKHVYIDVDDCKIETLLDMAADLAVYCKREGIELVPRGVEVADNVDGTFTFRYQIRSM